MTKEKEYVSINKAQKLTGVSYCVIKRMVLRGALDSFKKTKPTMTYYKINIDDMQKIKELHSEYNRNYIDYLS